MKGIEKQVLNIINKLVEADKKSVAFKLGIPAEYAAQICSILVKDGYIEEKPDGRFKLTSKGEKLTTPVMKIRKPFIKW